MNPLSVRFVAAALLAGTVWGAIGVLLAGQMLGPVVWGGAVVSPAIGLATALLFRSFRRLSPGLRIALALASLYVAAGLFALAVGVTDAARMIPNRNGGAVVIEKILGVWWGITFMGFLPLLWPIAYLTHSMLGRIEASASPAAPARD